MASGWQNLVNKGQALNGGLPFSFTSEGGTAPLTIQPYKPAARISRLLAILEEREFTGQLARGRIPIAFTHAEKQPQGGYAIWNLCVMAKDVGRDTMLQLAQLVNTMARLC